MQISENANKSEKMRINRGKCEQIRKDANKSRRMRTNRKRCE
ncbi:hypothetical protein J2T56_000866 [Natronobacillus azotifigens]|uniref:Uncharacterized protein n=1 Tax=Natronobacillus azotifigens TaxID=472978 RepID=A0A9J6RAX5_9BACI|nr:hypothetical protein [Natronobacillus azotifigens]MCZ0702468.1 hypothetical protein [Natronobacillus azotifigens]